MLLRFYLPWTRDPARDDKSLSSGHDEDEKLTRSTSASLMLWFRIHRHVVLNVDRGMTFEKATARLENNPGKESGFYRSRREMWGKTLYILATLKEGTSHTFKIARYNTDDPTLRN